MNNRNLVRIGAFGALIVAISIAAYFIFKPKREKDPESDRPVRIVSWGGQFQEDLLTFWIEPAARRANIKLEAEAWDGDYSALTGRIKRNINEWDLVHVEAHYVKNPEAKDIFESFPRKIDNLLAGLDSPLAVPALEYAYVLAYRKDQLQIKSDPDWKDFWDTSNYPGKRGVRDVPVGNIEIALLSLGKDLGTDLYSPQLSKAKVEETVSLALARFDELKPSIIWWKSGDQLQRDLESGDTTMAAAWSGRAWSAHKTLCGEKSPEDCVLRVNIQTALVSTDWWIIPNGARQADNANRLLKAMYQSDSIEQAAAFSASQGYAVPATNLQIKNEVGEYYLKLGSSANGEKVGRMDEDFWGKHYGWISERWSSWRLR